MGALTNAEVRDLRDRVKEKFEAEQKMLEKLLKDVRWEQKKPTDEQLLAAFEQRVKLDPDFIGACELTDDGKALLRQVHRILTQRGMVTA